MVMAYYYFTHRDARSDYLLYFRKKGLFVMNILTVNNLTKKYGDTTVIDNISFTIEHGKCVALIGPNGAGKTTALRMITRLIHPTAGTIALNKGNRKRDDRHFIGYLPQHPIFYPWMTGLQFLSYCAELSGIDKKTAEQKAEQLLIRVGLEDAKLKRISAYSGGMKQRLAIAQAIIHDPKLLIMDEPVSALDPIGRREVLTLMEQLKEKMSILFSTHILNDAEEISDELILLQRGKIVEYGALNALKKQYKTDKMTLTFDDGAERYLPQLQALDTIQRVTEQKNVLHVTVTDVYKARDDILQLIAENKWPLISFEVHRATLEDLFMKVVREHAMDDNVS